MRRGEPELQFIHNVPCLEEGRTTESVVHASRARRSKFFYSSSFTGERIWITNRPVRAYNNHQLPTSYYYPPGHFSQPVMSAPQSFPHVPSHPQYFGDIPHSFSQIPMAAPPPAVTGFLSAPMHTAASFQPYPGRFDVSAPGMS